MAMATAMRFLEVWYARLDAEDLLAELSVREDKATLKAAQKGLAKARKRTSLGSLSKFAERAEDGYRIKEQPPVIVRPPDANYGDLEQIIRQGLADYARTLSPERRLVLDHYHYVDFARKVVGVGSVGTEAFMILLMGDRDDDPLFLQVKEAGTSVLAPYAGAGEYEQQGERVVHGQRVMQAASDPFLGWATGTGARGRQFYVRQLRDMKGSAVIEGMPPARRRATARCAASRWRAPMPAAATPPRSPATSATTTRSTVRSSTSPSPTPTRTPPTTPSSPTPRTSSASRSNAACSGPRTGCRRAEDDDRRPEVFL